MTLKRKISTALVAALGLLGLFAAPASASPSQQTIFDASNDLLRADTVAERDAVLDQLQALGVDTLRLVVPWRSIVPSPDASIRPAGFDPTSPAAYGGGVMATVDAAVQGASARGITVLMTPSSPIPNWASASGASDVAAPIPSEYGALLTGLGRRYDGTFGGLPCTRSIVVAGVTIPIPFCLEDINRTAAVPPLPRVGFWSIYNEPNLKLFLQPGPGGSAGALYRDLFLAGQQGLATSGHGSDPLLIGETSPGSGRGSTDPIVFLRQVLCLNATGRKVGGCAPISAAGWAHHPYDPAGTPLRVSSRKLVAIPSLGKLTSALATAKKAGATTSTLPVYVTEYGVETLPGRHGVPVARQGDYLGLAEEALYDNPRVRSYARYLLDDDSSSNQFAFQTGLRTTSGQPKPALAAFPIALAVRSTGKRLGVWGHVGPGSGAVSVTVSGRSGAGVKVVRTVGTDALGFFRFSAKKGKATSWQASAQVGAQALRGPFVKAYPAG